MGSHTRYYYTALFLQYLLCILLYIQNYACTKYLNDLLLFPIFKITIFLYGLQNVPATTSTDLFEGPQYRIALFFCELRVGSCWIFLSNQYTI